MRCSTSSTRSECPGARFRHAPGPTTTAANWREELRSWQGTTINRSARPPPPSCSTSWALTRRHREVAPQGVRAGTPRGLPMTAAACQEAPAIGKKIRPKVSSLLAHPDGDDAVAVLLQDHAAVVVSVGAPLSTHGSALGVIAPREGIDTTRQTQRCEQQQHPHDALPQLCSGTNAAA